MKEKRVSITTVFMMKSKNILWINLDHCNVG